MTEIRLECDSDHEAIREVHGMAFRGEDEPRLVDRLRADGDLALSLVAVENDQVVGHIAFSRLLLRTSEGDLEAVALAPMGVLPEFQRRGIGSMLVQEGLRRFPETLVVVLGHLEFYPRFGFRPEHAAALRCPFSGPNLMATRPAEGELIYARGFSQWT